MATSIITNPIKTATNTVKSTGKQLATNKANTVLRDISKGKVSSIGQVTNPTSVANKILTAGTTKIPKGITSNPIGGSILNDLKNGASNKIGATINKIMKPTLPASFKIDMGGSVPAISKNIFADGSTNVFGTIECGFSGDAQRDFPSNQLIKIWSTSEGGESAKITAPLQEEFTLTVTSEWEPLVAPNSEFDKISKQIQAVTSAVNIGVTLLNPVTTRRIWKGTSPLSITVTLKFMSIGEEGVDKTRSEVLEPCVRLQRMVLPGSIDAKGIPILLSPPGPSATDFNPEGGTFGDQITIHIGQFKFTSVIIKEASVKFDNKLNSEGLPTSATCTLVFQTYQIMVKSEFTEAMLGIKNNQDWLSVAQGASKEEQRSRAEQLTSVEE